MTGLFDLAAFLVATISAAAVWMNSLHRDAVEGWQDEHGFHFGQAPEPRRMALVKSSEGTRSEMECRYGDDDAG